MANIIAVAIASGVVVTQLVMANAKPIQVPDVRSGLQFASVSDNLSALPPAPKGKSTVLGGAILGVDEIDDGITFKPIGQRDMKIFFDERTQVFLDGKKISTSEIAVAEHVSVQTILDGDKVFAMSIHMLSHTSAAELYGTVLNYNQKSRRLTIGGDELRNPIKLFLPLNTPVSRVGERQFSSISSGVSDLVKGSYISVVFEPDNMGHGTARRINVLSVPGAAFVFGGNISSIDIHTGVLVLVDPRDDHSYQISFNPDQLSSSQNIHNGDKIRVVATYDGHRYIASVLDINE